MQRQRGPVSELQPRQSLAEEVAAAVREDIVNGSLRPGERLIELDLAQVLGVSRGPIREGIRILVAQGLLAQEPTGGVIVPNMTESRARDVYGLRKAIETRAIRLLSLSDPTPQLDVLRQTQERLEQANARGDHAGVADEDINFHEALCDLSGNRRFVTTFQQFAPTIRLLFSLDERAYQSLQEIIAEHRPVLESLEIRNFTRATELLRSHIEHAQSVMTEFIRMEAR